MRRSGSLVGEARAIAAQHLRRSPSGEAPQFALLIAAGEPACRRSNDERLAVLPAWVAYHNAECTHGALGGITPQAALVNNLCGNHILGRIPSVNLLGRRGLRYQQDETDSEYGGNGGEDGKKSGGSARM